MKKRTAILSIAALFGANAIQSQAQSDNRTTPGPTVTVPGVPAKGSDDSSAAIGEIARMRGISAGEARALLIRQDHLVTFANAFRTSNPEAFVDFQIDPGQATSGTLIVEPSFAAEGQRVLRDGASLTVRRAATNKA